MIRIPLLPVVTVLFFHRVMAQDVPPEPAAEEVEIPPEEVLTCDYPQRPEREPFPSTNPNALTLDGDTEPNNTFHTAKPIRLGFADGFQPDVDIEAKIDRTFDVDWVKFEAGEADTLGVAVLAKSKNGLDSTVSLYDAKEKVLITNESHSGVTVNYPPVSPLPAPGYLTDPAFSYTFPAAGTYYLKIKGDGANVGPYQAQLRLRRPPMWERASGKCQILFLDFDGATNFRASDYFGAKTVELTNLSPFGSFLDNWKIDPSREPHLIHGITAEVKKHFNQLLAGTESKIEILNSLEQPDPFGEKNPEVSRVIVGGTIREFGNETIGLSQFMDPGNFSTNDTAVVLLDGLSAPSTNSNSVLNLKRASTFSVEQAVVRVVARVIVHEACHFLGCVHTENDNATPSTADGGSNLKNLAGVGPDETLGTADDPQVVICDDHFAQEGFSAFPSKERELVTAKVKAALAVGRQTLLAETAAVKTAITDLRKVHNRNILLSQQQQLRRFQLGQLQQQTLRQLQEEASFASQLQSMTAGSQKWLNQANHDGPLLVTPSEQMSESAMRFQQAIEQYEKRLGSLEAAGR
ncbi:MAG: hypothetical protein EOP87_04890 [Verrucomicrobiaceae bacterium]|nr:MAG: hypothetical protein EOP87_04890 [Verrucomicrobiaceae bacterium]